MQQESFLKRTQQYTIKVLSGMALGLFSSLLIGLIMKQLGTLLGIPLIVDFGSKAQLLMSGAIGAGVTYSLNAPSLVVFSCVIAGTLGGGAISFTDAGAILKIGEPVGAFVAALAGAEAGRFLHGKTKVDILVVPLTTILIGGLVGHFVAPAISEFMKGIGMIINFATTQRPFVMGILLSVIMGIILTLPISSAAIGISLGLSGLAAGAATVGCACHMIGFAVASYRDNGFGGLLSQGLGTSMLQMPNIIRKPIISLPAILASAILGPVSTIVFRMQGTPEGSGMGTSGLVGQFATIEAMGTGALPQILLMHFVFPAILAFLISEAMRRSQLIKKGDMKLPL